MMKGKGIDRVRERWYKSPKKERYFPLISLSTPQPVVIGVDLGGTNLRIAGVTGEGKVVTFWREKTRADDGPEALLNRILGGLSVAEEELRVAGRHIQGVALGVPGVVSRRDGVVESSPNLPGWRKVPLLEHLRQRLRLPLLLENDANAAVYGEYWAGAGRGKETIVLLTLGTGVGGGIIIDGGLLRGVEGMAGEIGHLTVEPEGEPCLCGNRGCLESYASARGIYARYARLAGKVPEDGEDGPPGAASVFARAQEGDDLARKAFSEAGKYLGIAMAALVNIINPEAIIVGGGVLPAWGFFMPAAEKEMLERAFQAPAEMVELLPAALGDRAGCIGAAGLLWKEQVSSACRELPDG
jgi:glucokinase